MSSFIAQLSKDHEEHEQLLQALTQSFAASDPPGAVRQRWQAFESSLLEHIDAEERSLFSVFTHTHRREIDTLRAEHRAIRYALIELSVCIELRTVKGSALSALLQLLREHAQHEDRSLHHWLAEDEGISSRRGVLAMNAHRQRARESLEEPAAKAVRTS
jgi:iron-sulfur cluster repair protein YtfE (RIC family)